MLIPQMRKLEKYRIKSLSLQFSEQQTSWLLSTYIQSLGTVSAWVELGIISAVQNTLYITSGEINMVKNPIFRKVGKIIEISSIVLR